jgi:hypothetical protein
MSPFATSAPHSSRSELRWKALPPQDICELDGRRLSFQGHDRHGWMKARLGQTKSCKPRFGNWGYVPPLTTPTATSAPRNA